MLISRSSSGAGPITERWSVLPLGSFEAEVDVVRPIRQYLQQPFQTSPSEDNRISSDICGSKPIGNKLLAATISAATVPTCLSATGSLAATFSTSLSATGCLAGAFPVALRNQPFQAPPSRSATAAVLRPTATAVDRPAGPTAPVHRPASPTRLRAAVLLQY